MSENVILKNFETYKKGLIKLFGEEVTEKLIDSLGGGDIVMNATMSHLAESGAAFKGSLIKNIISLTNFAKKINAVMPENLRADETSIYKVCMLCHISKALLYQENDNNWEIINRGMIFKFNTLNGALRTGERSILIAMNAGVKLNEFEFEAMRIIDKTNEDDSYTKYFSSPLSTVIRQANELIMLTNRLTKANENQ